MKIQKVTDAAFAQYGQVLEGYDFTELISKLNEIGEKPTDTMVYYPSVAELEALPIFEELQTRGFGGQPLEIGYNGGVNHKCACLEYHRNSEFNVACDDLILVLGKQTDIVDGKYDLGKVEAFLLPAGMGVEFYATTLHYGPISTTESGLLDAVILPRKTNFEKPEFEAKSFEDQLLFANNKWLLAHAEAPEAGNGAYVGLEGDVVVL